MLKIVATCEEENGCPLYRAGDGLEFARVAVQGLDFAPVCMRAVATLTSNIDSVRRGDLPENHQRTYCGGCDEGKAWFSFTTETSQTMRRVSPEFENFALQALAKTKVFAGTPPTVLKRVIGFMRERRAAPGDQIIKAGQAGEALFVIESGPFEVVTHDEHKVETLLATLSPGDCFGEMSLITGEPVSATVRSKEVGRLLAIPKSEFPRLLAAIPAVSLTLARILAQRLAKASSSVVEELKKGMQGRLDMVKPAELIQAMNVNSQTGMLGVQGGKGSASLFFLNGQVQDARVGTLSGEEAFYEFIKWTSGKFWFEMGKTTSAQTIRQDTVGMLLEGMRRLDEDAQKSQAPAPNALA